MEVSGKSSVTSLFKFDTVHCVRYRKVKKKTLDAEVFFLGVF